MDYKKEIRDCGSWIWMACFVVLAVLVAWAPGAGAYDRYSINGDATNCGTCHGDFRVSNYVSLVDGQSWGNLHDRHRTNMLSGQCNPCHSGSSRFPVLIGVSTGGSGLAGISCMGCHGRNEDAGHDTGSGGLGAGLRQHHTAAGVTDCQGCHSDADPQTYTPVGENVKPPYYVNPGPTFLNMPTDPCNRNGSENFAGALIGLDGDGDGLYDVADFECRPAPSRVDFDGDGKTDIAVWRPSDGKWYVKPSSGAAATVTPWGDNTAGDIPVPGDYDGDGRSDLAVWRASEGKWYVSPSSGIAAIIAQWGDNTAGDIAVPGDYDGDGKSDLAVWRPSNGTWYVSPSSGVAATATPWGAQASGDVPAPGDYDGDGRTDIAVWRRSDGKWYVKPSSGAAAMVASWGDSALGDVPAAGDYDGDGRTDIAVWRRSDGKWYVKPSSGAAAVVAPWGVPASSDVPLVQE